MQDTTHQGEFNAFQCLSASSGVVDTFRVPDRPAGHPLTLTRYPSIAPKGYRVETTRQDWLHSLREPIEISSNIKTKDEITRAKKHLPLWSPATFHENSRSLHALEGAWALGFDVDQEGADFDAVLDSMAFFSGILHTSISHTPEKPAMRLILWLSRPVNVVEYNRLHSWACDIIPGVYRAIHDPSRAWFLPTVRAGYEYRIAELTGTTIDVDGILPRIPEPPPPSRPSSSLPNSPAFESTDGGMPAFYRAERYLAAMGPWVLPEDAMPRGMRANARLFNVCTHVVRGFNLTDDEAFDVVWGWNTYNCPPYPVGYIVQMIEAVRRVGTMEYGHHLNAPRKMPLADEHLGEVVVAAE